MLRVVSFLLILIVSIPSSAAWDKSVTGKIEHVDVEVMNGDNAGFRVTFESAPALCTNEKTWAYVNKSHDNYQTAVSVLLAAKMADRSVTIYTNIGSWGGHCQIGYVVLR